MVMIVLFHSFLHNVFHFPIDVVTANRLWYQFVMMLGLIGNNIFVLISGYFLVKSPGLNFRRMINLWVRIMFYAVIVWSVLTLTGLQVFSLKGLIKCFMPITHRRWWFTSTYFLMYIVHPYLNIFLHAMSRDDYKKFLMTIGLCWSIIPVLTKTDFAYSELSMFIFLYCIGGYIRLWADDFGSRRFILYGLAFMGLNLLTAIVLDVIGLRFQVVGRNAEYFLHGGRPGMMRPFNILAALFLFVGFTRLNLKHSKFINITASATLGVYMLHENGFSIKLFWHEIFKFPSFQDSPYLIPYSITVVLLVYAICTLMELGRIKLFRTLSRGRLS